MKNSALPQRRSFLLAAITASFFALSLVQGRASTGYLEVFSSTTETQWGEGSHYYPHTGYRIADSNGRTIKRVENHSTAIDETPEKVELAPGKYNVWAESDKNGLVKVPVTIKPVQTTRLQLEETGTVRK